MSLKLEQNQKIVFDLELTTYGYSAGEKERGKKMLNRLHSQFELPNTYKKEDFDKMETTYTESDYTKNTTMNETLLLIKKSGKKNFDYENQFSPSQNLIKSLTMLIYEKVENQKQLQKKCERKIENIKKLHTQQIEEMKKMSKKDKENQEKFSNLVKKNKALTKPPIKEEKKLIMRKDEGTLVHKIKNDYGFHQYVKQKTINNTENYEFTIKIVKSENKKIMVGIVLKDRKNQVSSYSSGEAIVYSGFQGMIIFGEEKKKQMGNGFYEGSKVTVIVKVKQDKIIWKVNGKIEAEHSIGRFRYEKLYPYVEMYNKNDCIQWIDY